MGVWEKVRGEGGGSGVSCVVCRRVQGMIGVGEGGEGSLGGRGVIE